MRILRIIWPSLTSVGSTFRKRRSEKTVSHGHRLKLLSTGRKHVSRLEPHRHKLIVHMLSRRVNCKQAITRRTEGEEESNQT